MAGSMNKTLLLGNVGRDPELKSTPGGQSVARFSLATTENWKNQQGEKQSKTEWHNVVVWGKDADTLCRFVKKGHSLLVEGRIQYREYTDKDGVKKTTTDIRCDRFVFIEKADKGEGDGGFRQYGENQGGAPASSSGGSFPDDDIPF